MARATDQPSHQPGESTQRPSQFVAMQAEYRGPLPPPDMLADYEQIHPGTAERLIACFEQEAAHRHALEHRIVDGQIRHDEADVAHSRRGQNYAFILGALGLLIGGAVTIFSKTDAGAYAGAVIGGTTLVGLVTAFTVGRTLRPTDDVGKDESR